MATARSRTGALVAVCILLALAVTAASAPSVCADKTRYCNGLFYGYVLSWQNFPIGEPGNRGMIYTPGQDYTTPLEDFQSYPFQGGCGLNRTAQGCTTCFVIIHATYGMTHGVGPTLVGRDFANSSRCDNGQAV